MYLPLTESTGSQRLLMFPSPRYSLLNTNPENRIPLVKKGCFNKLEIEAVPFNFPSNSEPPSFRLARLMLFISMSSLSFFELPIAPSREIKDWLLCEMVNKIVVVYFPNGIYHAYYGMGKFKHDFRFIRKSYISRNIPKIG